MSLKRNLSFKNYIKVYWFCDSVLTSIPTFLQSLFYCTFYSIEKLLSISIVKWLLWLFIIFLCHVCGVVCMCVFAWFHVCVCVCVTNFNHFVSSFLSPPPTCNKSSFRVLFCVWPMSLELLLWSWGGSYLLKHGYYYISDFTTEENAPTRQASPPANINCQ